MDFIINAFFRQVQNPLDMLDDLDVIDGYHLPQGKIVNCSMSLGPQLMRHLAALRFFATSSFLQVVCDGL